MSDHFILLQCPYCNRGFDRQAETERHMKIHTKEKPFKCLHPVCDKFFSRRDNMMQHYRCHSTGGYIARREEKVKRYKELKSALKNSKNSSKDSSPDSIEVVKNNDNNMNMNTNMNNNNFYNTYGNNGNNNTSCVSQPLFSHPIASTSTSTSIGVTPHSAFAYVHPSTFSCSTAFVPQHFPSTSTSSSSSISPSYITESNFATPILSYSSPLNVPESAPSVPFTTPNNDLLNVLRAPSVYSQSSKQALPPIKTLFPHLK